MIIAARILYTICISIMILDLSTEFCFWKEYKIKISKWNIFWELIMLATFGESLI